MNTELKYINAEIEKNPEGFIKTVNNEYYSQLVEIADDIENNKNERPIILLSGPSGSGKTTTALMLEKILDERGVETHTLSMDNYFNPLNKEEQRLAAEGKMDLESPQRVDTEFLNIQLKSINDCEPIELPKYDFITSSRVKSGKSFQRKQGELVILEGIHALNPDVITLPDDELSKIYVSVRTRITDGDITLHPSKIRLMRRMVRDRNFRKRSLDETLNMFHNVEEGENKYIMPYKYRSNYDVDTFMAYEICAYKNCLINDLSLMTDKPVVHDATEILGKTLPIEPSAIPSESLICEFLGNGQFSY